MLETIDKLLALQDRDRRLLQLKEELDHIPIERQELNAKIAGVQGKADATKQQINHLESERKRLELEVEGKKDQINRYSLQQFQTKRNEEYRALAHEIDTCRQEISKIEDQELEFMLQADQAQKELAATTQSLKESKRTVDGRLADLAGREAKLKDELGQLEAVRAGLIAEVDETTRFRYERLLKNRGSNIIVGIHHGVCGGCHMQLSRQTIVHCRSESEIITCPNCARILYYTRDMDVAVVE
jgi:uncharacterized protein